MRTIKTDIDETFNKQNGSGDIDKELDVKRPTGFSAFIGQEETKKHLKIYIEAAKKRGDVLDHILFYGSPGLGKTTLAGIIANEMKTGFKLLSGPTIEKPGDMASVLAKLQEGDCLFIDEIHRLPVPVEELLYTAMEDYSISIMIGQGEQAKCIQIPLPKFTLIGATTRAGMLSDPLRDRFGIVMKLDYYTAEELGEIVSAYAHKLGDEIDREAALLIGSSARETPRVALKNYRRIRDFSTVKGSRKVTKKDVEEALKSLKISSQGISETDVLVLRAIHEAFNDGPVGLNTLAAIIGENPDTLEDMYEPFLLRKGYIARTSRGRCITEKGINFFISSMSSEALSIEK